MKFATYLFLAITLLASAATLNAATPAGAAQSFIAFTGGSVWTSGSTGTCIWYFPVLADLDLKSLFATDPNGNLVINKEHAYLIWVSDWSIAAMFGNSGFGGSSIGLAVVPAGTATIYYTNNPTRRDFSDISKRATWGIPVATFTRGAGLFQSPDNFQLTDKFYFSAPLLAAKDFNLGGRVFNFRILMPHGMTCFEYGQGYSTTETGSCIAMGN
jgi:hypothetical protein